MRFNELGVKCVTVLLLGLALVAAACGSDDSGGSSASSDGEGGGAQGDAIVVSGSSTVEPISALVAEQFSAANDGFAVAVDGPGTGTGFERFCSGETDISDASRTIKDEEAAICEEAGIEYTELLIAIDGLSVLTSVNNDAVSCLNFEDLYALVGPESLGVENWADAQELAAELGSSTTLPDASLSVFGPGEESGTFDSFVEIVIEDIAEARGQDPTTRPDYDSSANDRVIIEGIAGSDTSLGWVGYAFFVENSDTVAALEVDGGDGCVAPTDETISSNEYPISRNLYIYVNNDKAATNPALVDFVDYYLSAEGIANVSMAGYVQLADSDLETTRSTWAEVG